MKLSPTATRHALLAFACSCASIPDADAQGLPTIVVTGTVQPRTLGSEFAATSVLTRDELQRTGVRDVVAALELLGTALVEQQGGPGTAAFVRLRGADSRDTLVLVDGVPLNDVTLGLASLSQLPVADIERIEVARGNLSALYGANATGGVIHVFTRRGATGLRGEANATGGSRATRAIDASVSAGSADLRGRVTLGAERTDGYSAIDPAVLPSANPDADGNHRRHAALAVDADVVPGHGLGLDLRVVRGRVEYDDGSSFSGPTDTHRQYLLQRNASLRGRHALGADWSFEWRAAEGRETRREESVTSFGAASFGNDVRNRGVSAEANGRIAAGWQLQLGAERLVQSTDSPDYLTDRRRTDVLRAGIVHDAAWGSVQAAVRRDDTSDFGRADTGLLGATWRFAPHFSAIATLANSFTPPTLDMLFYAFCCSNPALRPERSRNADLGLQWEDGAHLVRLTAFVARQRDKIVNDDEFIPHNVARTKNQGFELAARTRIAAWRLAGEATVQDPVDVETGQRLPRRASHQAAVRADYDGSGWTAGARLRHVGDRPDIGGAAVPAYSIVDLSGRWQLSPAWNVRLTVENAFDRDYQTTAGYRGKPRGVFLGLGWQGGR
jgi:vitamin B12 transporter